MAYGISAVIPLQKDDQDGFYVLTKSLLQNIKQNFKNLVLTTPGERVMIPEFGVGVRRYLFDNPEDVKSEISFNIADQVSRYMPFISVDDLEFFEENEQIILLKITYSVPSQSIFDLKLEIGL